MYGIISELTSFVVAKIKAFLSQNRGHLQLASKLHTGTSETKQKAYSFESWSIVFLRKSMWFTLREEKEKEWCQDLMILLFFFGIQKKAKNL